MGYLGGTLEVSNCRTCDNQILLSPLWRKQQLKGDVSDIPDQFLDRTYPFCPAKQSPGCTLLLVPLSAPLSGKEAAEKAHF